MPKALLANLLMAAALTAACGDSPTEPHLASIVVSVQTSGEEPDMNGYEIRSSSLIGVIGPNGTAVVKVPAGIHTVTLEEVAYNCAVSGQHPLRVEVAAGRTVHVKFNVTCAPTEKIAYSADGRIVVASGNGSSPVDLGKGYSPSWSPDGTRLVYSTTVCVENHVTDDSYDCAGNLVIVDRVTRASTALARSDLGRGPAWAPAGDVIAFTACCEPASWNRLYFLGVDGRALEHVTVPGVLSLSSPSWSPDGRRIAFTCSFDPGATDLCAINRDGTGFTRITKTPSHEADPVWSPDGRRIAFSHYDGAWSIALMNADGTGETAFGNGYQPAWSRDGTRLVFARAEGLFTMNTDLTNLRQLTSGKHFEPALQP